MTEVQPQAQQLATKEDHTLTADFVVGRKPHMVSAQLQLRGNSKLALFGPSGAGKTTIIEAIAGLARLESGWVQLDSDILSQASPRSRHVALWQRTIGLLRQPPGLFPHLSALENITYSSRPPRNGLAAPLPLSKLLELLDLTDLAPEMPYRLSGGQLQRVAIARVLYSPFKLLLLDEPYTGLDASWRDALTKLIINEVDRRHVPCIVVTHDLVQAQEVADEIAVIQDGRILQRAPADEIVRKPNSKEVAQLVGYRSFIAAASSGKEDTAWAIHPQKVILGEHPKFGMVLQGIVKSVKPAGVEWEVEMEVTQPNSIQTTITFMHNYSVDQFHQIAQDMRVQNNLRPGCQMTVTAIDPPLIPNSRPPTLRKM